MKKEYLATTATGIDVYIGERTLQHMQAHSDVSMEHIREAIRKNDTYTGPFELWPINLGRVIGKDGCIQVKEDDPDVQHLYRKGRNGTTPVVFDRPAPDTSVMTIGICLDDDGKHTMFTAFYGPSAPKEPWDPSLSDEGRAESEAFWRTHALVVSRDEIDWDRSH